MSAAGTLIVTGASQGIGAATALMAAAKGYRVCLNYRRNSDLTAKVVDQIWAQNGEAFAHCADVASEDDVRQMFDETEDRFGAVTGLVNNAGILKTQTKFVDIEVSRFREILQTNLIGSFICSREALRRMSSENGGDGGAIVNVSSVAARTGSPYEYVDYAASKGALDTMSTGLAREAAPLGVRVNSVRPGFIHTGMHASGGEPDRVSRLAPNIPLRRGGDPDEVASAIMWLLSDKASYAVGTTVDVAGGV